MAKEKLCSKANRDAGQLCTRTFKLKIKWNGCVSIQKFLLEPISRTIVRQIKYKQILGTKSDA